MREALLGGAHEVSSNDVTEDFKVIVALAVEDRCEDVGDVFHKIEELRDKNEEIRIKITKPHIGDDVFFL